jgi:hypothetical protein
MARTWLIGIVRVTLSSPAICTSLGEAETTVPATLVPSRSSTVACCPPPEVLLQEQSSSTRHHIAAEGSADDAAFISQKM